MKERTLFDIAYSSRWPVRRADVYTSATHTQAFVHHANPCRTAFIEYNLHTDTILVTVYGSGKLILNRKMILTEETILDAFSHCRAWVMLPNVKLNWK